MNFVPALNALDKLPNTIKYKDMDADERKARLDLYTRFVRLALEGIVSAPWVLVNLSGLFFRS